MIYIRFLLSLLCAAAGAAASLPAGVEAGASMEGIAEYRLENGLRMLLIPDPGSASITVNMTVLVGSRNEGYGETGMAHLLEHMTFKRTASHPEPLLELARRGARPNGTTLYDRTNYYATFPSSDENLKWVLDLEADRLVRASLLKSDLDTEMKVVRNEFEIAESRADRVLFRQTLAAAYRWHNYGKAPLGTLSDIENVPIDHLRSFYERYYQPDNTVLVIAGRLDPEKTIALAVKSFGVLPRPTRKLTPTWTVEPPQDGERSATIRWPGGVSALDVVYHVPAGSHPDYAALQVLAGVLGGSPSGRLYSALVRTRMATRVSGDEMPLREPGFLILSAEVSPNSSAEDVRRTMLASIENFPDQALDPEELERARREIVKQIELDLRNSEKIGLQLSEWAALSDWRLLFVHLDRLRKVSGKDVLRVAQTYLRQSNRTVGEYVPVAAKDHVAIPAAPDVAAMLKDFHYESRVSDGEVFDSSPENIAKRLKRSTLPSGMKLVLLPKKTRGQVVSAEIDLHFGDEKSLQGKRMAGQVAVQMLMRGAAGYSYTQLEDEFNRLQTRVQINGTATGLTASLQTTSATLGPAIRLVGRVLRQPAFPEAEFERMRQGLLNELERRKADPRHMAQVAYYSHVFPYPDDDVRANLLPEAEALQVRALTLNDVRQFYNSFVGASAGVMAVAGEFDPEEAERAAAESFADWKSPAPWKDAIHAFQTVPGVSVNIETPGKENAVLYGGERIDISAEDPDYPPLLMAGTILGAGPDSRLFRRLRMKEGLTYSAGAFLSARPREAAHLQIFIAFAPRNLERIETALREEISLLASGEVTEDEVERAKRSWQVANSASLAKDPSLVITLADDEVTGRTMAWHSEMERRVGAVTARDVTAALRRELKSDRLSLFKAGSFAPEVSQVRKEDNQ